MEKELSVHEIVFSWRFIVLPLCKLLLGLLLLLRQTSILSLHSLSIGSKIGSLQFAILTFHLISSLENLVAEIFMML